MKYVNTLIIFLYSITFINCQDKITQIHEDKLNIKSKDKHAPLHYSLKNGEPLNGKYKILLSWTASKQYLISDFKNGFKEGIGEHYRNDILIEKAEFCQGQFCGLHESYYENGVLARRKFFNKDQKLEGVFTHYREKDGNILRKSLYKNGVKNGKEYIYLASKNGMVRSERNYLNGKLEGEEIGYNEDGSLDYKKNYKNGVLNGIMTSISKDEKIESTFKNGKKNGPSYRYYKMGDKYVLWFYYEVVEGETQVIIEYDRKTGDIIEERYYLDGKKISKEEYEQNKDSNK